MSLSKKPNFIPPQTANYEEDWTALRLYLGYRVVLASMMILLFFAVGRGPLGTNAPTLFTYTVQGYMVLTLLSVAMAVAQPHIRNVQAIIAVFFDIFFITLLMHASGGVQSGLGILIAIAIGLGSMSLGGRTSLLFASLGTLAVLTEQVFAQLTNAFPQTAYVQAGLLGISFFALAALVHKLATRAQRSEELASQRGVDLVNLAQLNDYVIQQMQAGIVVIDSKQILQIMNEAAWVMLGMPSALRHHPLATVSPRLYEELLAWDNNPERSSTPFRAVGGGRDIRAEFTHLGHHGDHGTLIVLEDTAALNAQAQQIKLASLGRLTASIAHEIRNPLGAISHAAQLLNESPQLPDEDRRMSEIIQQNSRRVNQVIQNILKMSRQEEPTPELLDLHQWLKQRASEIRSNHHLNEQQLVLSHTEEILNAATDPGQLQQTLDVLCENAISHFHREPHELRLRIESGRNSETLKPYINVCDNGKGIDPAHAEKLFEPFFTTTHKGTGLGLYIARQLCEANRIHLEYRAMPEGGSCFRLTLPKPQPELNTEDETTGIDH